jgi:hypothetical protein
MRSRLHANRTLFASIAGRAGHGPRLGCQHAGRPSRLAAVRIRAVAAIEKSMLPGRNAQWESCGKSALFDVQDAMCTDRTRLVSKARSHEMFRLSPRTRWRLPPLADGPEHRPLGYVGRPKHPRSLNIAEPSLEAMFQAHTWLVCAPFGRDWRLAAGES